MFYRTGDARMVTFNMTDRSPFLQTMGIYPLLVFVP